MSSQAVMQVMGLAVLLATAGVVVYAEMGTATLIVLLTGPAMGITAFITCAVKPATYRMLRVLALGLVTIALGALVWHAALLGPTGPVAVYLGLGTAVGATVWRWTRHQAEQDPLTGRDKQAERHEHDWARHRQIEAFVARHVHHRHPAVAAAARTRALPLANHRGPILGRWEQGDLQLWRQGRAVVIPWPTFHIGSILGMTGAGKSELQLRITEYAMSAPNRPQIIWISWKEGTGKPDDPIPRLELAAARHSLTTSVLHQHSSAWDPFRGNVPEVRERLIGVETFGDPYWEAISRVVVGLVLHLRARSGDPIQELGELVRAMTEGRLDQLRQLNLEAAEFMDSLNRQETRGAWARFASAAMASHGWTASAQRGAWAWEDADVSLVEVPTTSQLRAAEFLSQLMLADVNSFIFSTTRRPRLPDGSPRPLVIVLEELGALVKSPKALDWVVNVAERARGANVKTLVVAQSPGSLGDDATRDRLCSQGFVISGAQVAGAQYLSDLAGTVMIPEASVGHLHGTAGIAGSLRYQHQRKVDPNLVRQLPIGRFVAINRGRWCSFGGLMPPSAYQGATTSPTLPLPDSRRALVQKPTALPPGEDQHDDDSLSEEQTTAPETET
jgi:hypothetical protein